MKFRKNRFREITDAELYLMIAEEKKETKLYPTGVRFGRSGEYKTLRRSRLRTA